MDGGKVDLVPISFYLGLAPDLALTLLSTVGVIEGGHIFPSK